MKYIKSDYFILSLCFVIVLGFSVIATSPGISVATIYSPNRYNMGTFDNPSSGNSSDKATTTEPVEESESNDIGNDHEEYHEEGYNFDNEQPDISYDDTEGSFDSESNYSPDRETDVYASEDDYTINERSLNIIMLVLAFIIVSLFLAYKEVSR